MDSTLAEKIGTLTPEQISEVQDFIDSLRLAASTDVPPTMPASLSEPAFAAIWSDPEDDVYDAA
jgi:hypothetical protein